MKLISNLIRWARTTLADKSETVQNLQVTYMGTTSVAHVVTPFGMSANVPVGTEGLLFQVGASPDNLVFFPYPGVKRVSGLSSGEIVLQDPVSGGQMVLGAGGKVALGHKDIGEALDLMQQLVQALQSATVNTAIGPQPLDAATQTTLTTLNTTLTALKGTLR